MSSLCSAVDVFTVAMSSDILWETRDMVSTERSGGASYSRVNEYERWSDIQSDTTYLP